MKGQITDDDGGGMTQVYIGYGVQGRHTWVSDDDLRPRVEGQEPEPASDVARLREACEALVKGASQSFTLDEPKVGWFVSVAVMATLRAALAAPAKPVTPVGDTARLREACEMALQILAYSPEMGWGSKKVTKTVAALRVALAATPKIEGPVREGDVVQWTTRGQVTFRAVVSPDTVAVRLLDQDSEEYVSVRRDRLAIVSRPAPKAPAHRCGECRWLASEEKHTWAYPCRHVQGSTTHVTADTPACEHFELYQK